MSNKAKHGWLIHKAGRGWYRPNAQGYTIDPAQAGRYSYDEAIDRSHPNGPDGPRDGMTIKHENALRPAPAVPDDVAGLVAELRDLPHHLTREAADALEAQAAELARLRSEAETTSAALSQAWVREGAAIAQRDAALDACNQARLAFVGYVSQQSAVDKLDAALTHPTGD